MMIKLAYEIAQSIKICISLEWWEDQKELMTIMRKRQTNTFVFLDLALDLSLLYG